MNKLDLSNTADRTFPHLIRQQAQQNGDTEFLVTDNMRISFAQADAITDCLAAGLQRLGIGKGDIVALFLGNRPERYYSVWLSTNWLRYGPQSMVITKGHGCWITCRCHVANY